MSVTYRSGDHVFPLTLDSLICRLHLSAEVNQWRFGGTRLRGTVLETWEPWQVPFFERCLSVWEEAGLGTITIVVIPEPVELKAVKAKPSIFKKGYQPSQGDML